MTRWQTQARRFLLSAVMAAGLALHGLFMQVLHGYLHWHYLLAQLLTTGLTMFWNLLAHRFWTFARSQACG
ncbi:MAG: GtrA family protein [Steroidobacteraceae bacterium]